jgi:hypothetical protein
LHNAGTWFLIDIVGQRLVADYLPAPSPQLDEVIMKKHLSLGARLFACVLVPLTVVMMLAGPPAARAGLQIDMHLYGAYYCFPWLSTNSTPPSPTNTAYFVWSPTSTINTGIHFQLNPDNGIDGSGSSVFSDYQAFILEITNGNWTLLVTNSVSTNLYTFTVTVPSTITSNLFAPVNITSPTSGQINVANTPTFTWSGPAGWAGSLDVWDDSVDNNNNHSRVTSASLTPNQTSWPSPVILPDGTNSFSVKYTSDATAVVTVSTPVDNLSDPFLGFSFISTLETSASQNFYVGAITSPFNAYLVARYDFEITNSPSTDSSGNGNDANCGSGNNSPTNNDTFSTSAAVGSYAREYFGNNAICFYPNGAACFNNISNALYGSFSLSAWVNTTNSVNSDWDNAYFGSPIWFDYNSNTNSAILSITGSKAAFTISNPDGTDTVLHSTTSVNDGSYHFIAVTRNQTSGLMSLYVDGHLEATGASTSGSVIATATMYIAGGYDGFYSGLLDDVRVYSTDISAADVANFYANPGSTTLIGNASGGHTLIAHYAFDNSGNLGQDSSSNGNDMSGPTWWGPVYQFSMDAEAGGGAVRFFDTSCLYADGQTLTNLNAVLVGSFTFSTWVNTTVSNGPDYDNAVFGATIFWAYNDHGNTNDTIPLSITGSKAAFTTRDHTGNFNTLHSITSVNDGHYHLITVTRNQATGEKKIYVDGNFETSEIGTTEPLNGDNYRLTIGGWDYCTDGNCTNFYAYNGLLDDLQIYTGVLSDTEVASLYTNPGTTVPNMAANNIPLGDALNNTDLTWTSSGDLPWFGETTNTYDNVSAAQSGAITDSQISDIQTTVPSNGLVSFYWKVSSEDGYDYLTFYINGNQQDAISGEVDWNQETYSVSAGDVLLWEYSKDSSDSSGLDAGFLDQVSYVPDLTPIITLNPFNQTNYPGYNVALLAAAINAANSPITWQWFEGGNASPIPNATNALFIPTNSGTAGVAGSYYAVASGSAGSANTTTASVSFVSAPLPPDWSRALKSPFGAVDDTVFNKDYYYGCTVDSAGEVYVAAQYFGNMDVLTNGYVENVVTAVGTNGAAALVKHDANGSALWAVGLTNNQSASSSYGQCVAPAPGNGAYLASFLSGTNWLGTNIFVETAGGSILLSRFDANGSNVWSKFIGGANSIDTSYNMLVSDASGNVTLAGNMSGTVSFGGTNLSSPAGGGFIVQYDSNGAVRWAQTIPVYTYGLAYGNGLIYASLQSTVASGVPYASIGSLSNVTDRAWAVACLNAANGQPLWLRGVGHQYGANFTGEINDMPLISLSGSNVFLIANTYGSSVVFGGLSVPLPGGRGQYFARYDTNGNPQAATVFGNPTTMIWASAANASGVYVSGDFDSYSQFGNLVIAAPLFTTNDLDFSIGDFSYIYFTQPLVAKFDLNGNPLWARNGVSSVFANFRGIATTSDGVWASGFLKIKDLFSRAQFGTNFVYSDLYVPGSGGLSPIILTQAGMIAKIAEPTYSPVATDMLVTRTAGLSVKIFWADVTNQWSDPDGNAVTLAGINLVTTNAVTVSTNGLLILYPASAPNVADQISYTISDSLGATATGYINIVVNSNVTGTNSITSITQNGNSSTTVTAYGIPTYSYILERATNLAPAIWVDITTNAAAANGIITATDNFMDLDNVAPVSAFYRLKWQP